MPEIARIWAPGNIVRNQQAGPEVLRPFEDKPLSDQYGFAGGFATSFRLAAGAEIWFHFPFATPVMLPGAPQLYLDHTSLLWEAKDGAEIAWVTIHHGGAERIELTSRLTILAGRHVEAASVFPARPRLHLKYGVQMCVLVRSLQNEGVVQFYGAGLSFSDQP
ncbi:MAG: hypothetical protein JNJ73_03410 [Hyphomonadaceae bacterium]|nr:hypothetical protein [Hyphomonadaceae bacterium]